MLQVGEVPILGEVKDSYLDTTPETGSMIWKNLTASINKCTMLLGLEISGGFYHTF